MSSNKLLTETKIVARTVDYFVNPTLLGEFKTTADAERAVIQHAADDYCDIVDTINLTHKYYSNLLNREELLTELERDKNKYMAVLMVKFWREIGKMQRKCQAVTLLEYGDYYSKLFYCIDTAMSYRAWRNGTKKTNAQACINATISSRGAAEILYQSNLQINKANINTASLDAPVNGDSDDKETTLADLLEDPAATKTFSGVDGIIQMYLDDGKVEAAIVIDAIGNGDSIKTTSETSRATIASADEEGVVTEESIKVKNSFNQFDRRKVVKILSELDDEYLVKFQKKFQVTAELVVQAFNAIKSSQNQKLYATVDKTLVIMKNDFARISTFLL